MWRWFSAMLVTSVAGANLEASQQDGILKLLTADSAHGASSTTASSQGNASKTSKAKAKTTQMEDMVLLLAQQAKAAREASKNKDEDKEMEEMIEQLRQELKMMQTEINEAANTSNAAPMITSPWVARSTKTTRSFCRKVLTATSLHCARII